MDILAQLTIQLGLLLLANVATGAALTAGVVLAAHALRGKVAALVAVVKG